MTKIYRFILILILFFIIIIPPAESTLPYSPDEKKPPPLSLSIEHQIMRDKLIKIDKLLDMDILKIRPGMTILEIGTGPGYYAFKFAERLKGTGKVFATDIVIDRLDYMKEEALKRGFRNLYPVLVKMEGVDEFYSKHKYDLIFLCNVYHRLDNRVDYFKKMRDFLAENGQLTIIICKSVFLFYVDDFTDFKGLIKELSQELHVNKPFYERLRESTRELIKQQSNSEPNELLKNAIVDDFNQMLLNPHFYNEFQRTFIYKTVSFSPAEKNFYNWLLMCLKEEGVFDRGQKNLNPKEIRAIIKLNKLIFLQRFRQYLYGGEVISRLYTTNMHLQTSKFLVKRELKEAGYKFEKEYDSLPYHVILFFTANKEEKRE